MVVTAIEGGKAFAVLKRGCTDQRVAKLKGVAPAIAAKALTSSAQTRPGFGLGVARG
jgi:hypothetical protein